ncbi:hypothetical protein D3C76_1377040 [compost metagenome]
MLVVVVVGDIQAHFMHLGRPAEQLTPDTVFQVPGLGHLVEGVQGFALDPGRLALIDVITLHQRVQGALTHVFMMMTAEQVVEHAFAQGAFAVVHALQFQRIENRFHDRQAGREDRPAVRFDAIEVDLVGFAQFEQLAFEPGQALGIDFAAAHAA